MLGLLSFFLLSPALATYTHEMNCRPELPDAFRYTAVNNINKYRELLTNGTAPNSCGFLPKAKNMYKIFYDCSLETAAYNYAASCGTTAMPANSMVWMHMSSGAFSESQLIAFMVERLNTDLTLAVTNGVDTLATVTASNGAWAQYATGVRTRIGCAYKPDCDSGNANWPVEAMYICIFDEPKPANGKQAYDLGSKCTVDSDCTSHIGSECETSTGLCLYKFEDDGSNDQCGATSTALTDAQRDVILNWHNRLRSSLAQGKEADGGDFVGSNAPGSAKMRKMRYNCSIEVQAKAWADVCTWAHSDQSARPSCGENLFMSSSNTLEFPNALADAPQAWWSELPQFGVGSNLTFEDDNIDYHNVGHYTQMAWQDTTDLGCAVVHCPTMTFVVCQYYPQGNIKGQTIYEKGSGCTSDAACGTGYKCSPSDGLCERV